MAQVSQKPSGFTLQTLYDRIVKHKSLGRAESTVLGYKTAFNSLLKFLPKTQLAASLTLEQIHQWQAQAGVQPSTLNQYTQTLGEAYRQAVAWGSIRRNPFDDVGRLKTGRTTNVRYFSEDQTEALLASVRDNVDVLWVSFCLRAGMRISESINVKKRHLTAAGIQILKTKTSRARTVPVSNKLAVVLEQFEELTIDRNQASHRWLRIIDRAGVAGTPHMLRHTFSARKLSAGVSVFTVSRWLGHSSVQTTEQIYGHLIPGSQDHLINEGE